MHRYQEIKYVYFFVETPFLILIEYLIHLNTVGMEWIILYFRGMLVKLIPVKCCNMKIVFILANSEDADRMQPRPDLHCLPKYLFTSIPNEKNLKNIQNEKG